MPTRYSATSVVLHWLVAAAMIAAFFIGQSMESIPRGPERAGVMGWHILIGLSVVILFVPRVLARLQGTPAVDETGSAWTQLASKLVHLVLYVVMVLLPVLGITAIVTGTRTVDVLGLFAIQPLWPAEFVHESAEEIHQIVAKVFLFTLIVHILATLWHALVRRDDVAGRMIPFLARPDSAQR